MTCPNINAQEWKDLVATLNNSRILAMQAFNQNNGEIPDINSDIVKEIKKSLLNLGKDVKVVLDKDGNETNEYVEINKDGSEGAKKFMRISDFIKSFSLRRGDRSKSMAERKADRFWGDTDPDTKLMTDAEVPQTKQEYKDYIQHNIDLATAKGNLIHLSMLKRIHPEREAEVKNKIEQIVAKYSNENGMLPFNWEWINNKGVIEKIFDNVGVNYFHELTDSLDDILRDELFSEISVSSDELGIAGTLDMLARHSDGTYTIVDWKTGKSLNRVFRGMDDILMRYGNQATREITDSVRNRAKLQLALYAVLLKSQNPDMQFRSLNLGWIPGEYDALQKDGDMAVDAFAFIPMIESILGDAEFLKENGLPSNIKEILKAKDRNIFDPKGYSTEYSKNLSDEIRKGKMTPEQILEDKLQKIKYITGKNLKYAELSKEDKDNIQVLLDDINKLIKDDSITPSNKAYDDISKMDLWIGNYSELKHPLVQTWKSFKDKQFKKAQDISEMKMSKFRSLLRPVMKDYLKKNNILNIAGNKSIVPDDLYSFMYTDDFISDQTSQTKERLLTSTETDEKLKAKYDALTPAQKSLLDYVNDQFSSYFEGEGAFLNETATQMNGRDISHIKLYNFSKEKKDRREYSKGFFFKLPPTDEDIILRNGNGNYLKGKLSKKTLGSLIYNYGTFFRENNFERWRDDFQALPIKYMGNDYIEKSRSYTKNMEVIFQKSIESLEYKRHMDGVYAIGRALHAKLDAEKDVATGAPLYENLSKALDLRLMMDLQRKMIISNPRSRSIRVPMYTPEGWSNQKISVDMLLRALTKWASMNTMWLRPWQGFGNGAHATMLTHREGIKGSIAKLGLLGIDGEAIDFTEGDIVKAEKLYFSDYLLAGMKSELRNSKMFLLAKEFNYFGDNFEYASMDKTMLSMRNRHMNESSMYMFHSVPEEFVSLTTMTAQLLHMKNKSTGKSIYDSYEVEDVLDNAGKPTGEKKLKWVGGVRGVVRKGSGETAYTEELKALDSNEIAKLRKVHERLQGGYRKDEAMLLEIYSFGKMVVHLKKYFPRLILNLIHSKRTETDLGIYRQMFDKDGKPIYKDENGVQIPVYEWQRRVTEGRFITLANVFVNLATGGKFNKQYKMSALEAEQKTNIVEAVLTMAILAGTYTAYLQMFGDLDDDDPRKKWFKMYLVDNLSQQYNVVDLFKTMKTVASPVALAKLSDFTSNFATMMFASANYAVGNEDEAFTKRGDLRGWNNFAKTIPYLSSYKDVMNKFDKIDDANWFTDTFGIYDGTRLK